MKKNLFIIFLNLNIINSSNILNIIKKETMAEIKNHFKNNKYWYLLSLTKMFLTKFYFFNKIKIDKLFEKKIEKKKENVVYSGEEKIDEIINAYKEHNNSYLQDSSYLKAFLLIGDKQKCKNTVSLFTNINNGKGYEVLDFTEIFYPYLTLKQIALGEYCYINEYPKFNGSDIYSFYTNPNSNYIIDHIKLAIEVLKKNPNGGILYIKGLENFICDRAEEYKKESRFRKNFQINTVNGLLTLLDSLDYEKDKISLVFSLPYEYNLDPAFIRPGRMGEIIKFEKKDLLNKNNLYSIKEKIEKYKLGKGKEVNQFNYLQYIDIYKNIKDNIDVKKEYKPISEYCSKIINSNLNLDIPIFYIDKEGDIKNYKTISEEIIEDISEFYNEIKLYINNKIDKTKKAKLKEKLAILKIRLDINLGSKFIENILLDYEFNFFADLTYKTMEEILYKDPYGLFK